MPIDPSNLIAKIDSVLSQNQLTTQTDLRELIDTKVAEKENNIRFVCSTGDGQKYIAKFSIDSLGHRPPASGIRAQMNLQNEVRFYQQIQSHKFENLIIPRLLTGEDGENAYLIIEFLDSDKYHIFDPKIGFQEPGYPDFFAEALVVGLREFHSLEIDQALFPKMDIAGTRDWLVKIGEELNGLAQPEHQSILDLFDAQLPSMLQGQKAITHSDIVPDAIGYELATHKLVLLDFEKVQLSMPAFDYSAFAKSPAHMEWVHSELEPKLFAHISNPEFRTSYYLFKLLRLISMVAAFQSGRIDHVFEAMLGKTEFQALKAQASNSWLTALRSNLALLAS